PRPPKPISPNHGGHPPDDDSVLGPDTPDIIVGESSSSGSLAGSSSSGSGTASVTADAASSGLVINVSYDGSVNKAPAGFKTVVGQVVQYFQSHFSDPVTVNIDVG